MSRTDFWRWSATRVEIDHRAREARLRLDRLERLLMLRLLPTRPWLIRLPYMRGSRSVDGGRLQSRSDSIDQSGTQLRRPRRFPADICCTAVSGLAAFDGMPRPRSPA